MIMAFLGGSAAAVAISVVGHRTDLALSVMGVVAAWMACMEMVVLQLYI